MSSLPVSTEPAASNAARPGPSKRVRRARHRSTITDLDGGLARAGPASVMPTSFGSTPLSMVKLLGLRVVLAAFELADDGDFELMRAGRNVAGVDPLHAALLQRFEFLEAVDVVRDQLAVDLDLHRVESHRIALRERDEQRNLRVRGIQQLLLEPTAARHRC